MLRGNWIPIDARMANELPKDRAYSKIEAMYSLQLNYDQGNTVTVAGLAKSWSWSRKKVVNFIKRIGIGITYGESLGRKQNQRGRIIVLEGTDREQIGGRYGTDREQIRLINNKDLEGQRDRLGADGGQMGDRYGSTIYHPSSPSSFIYYIPASNSEEPNGGSNMDDSDNIISQPDPHRAISPSNEESAEDNRSPGIRVASDQRTDSRTGGGINGQGGTDHPIGNYGVNSPGGDRKTAGEICEKDFHVKTTGEVDGTRREADTGGASGYCKVPGRDAFLVDEVLRSEDNQTHQENQGPGSQEQVIPKTKITGGVDGHKDDISHNAIHDGRSGVQPIGGISEDQSCQAGASGATISDIEDFEAAGAIGEQVISKTETTGGDDDRGRQNQDDARSIPCQRGTGHETGRSVETQQTLPGISGTSGTAGEDMRDSTGIDNSAHPDFGEGAGLRSCNKQENCREGVDKRYSERSSKKRNGKSLDLSGIDVELLPVIEEFIEYRRVDKKDALSQLALTRALSGFAKSAKICKIPAEWVVRYAMIRGWLIARPQWIINSLDDIKLEFKEEGKEKPKHLVACTGCMGFKTCRNAATDKQVECSIYTPINEHLQEGMAA
jgi:hypothetical protein